MEQDEANEDFLPGIGELKTFSQVIRSKASLGFKIELTDAFTFIGNTTTETLFQVTLNMGISGIEFSLPSCERKYKAKLVNEDQNVLEDQNLTR